MEEGEVELISKRMGECVVFWFRFKHPLLPKQAYFYWSTHNITIYMIKTIKIYTQHDNISTGSGTVTVTGTGTAPETPTTKSTDSV